MDLNGEGTPTNAEQGRQLVRGIFYVLFGGRGPGRGARKAAWKARKRSDTVARTE